MCLKVQYVYWLHGTAGSGTVRIPVFVVALINQDIWTSDVSAWCYIICCHGNAVSMRVGYCWCSSMSQLYSVTT